MSKFIKNFGLKWNMVRYTIKRKAAPILIAGALIAGANSAQSAPNYILDINKLEGNCIAQEYRGVHNQLSSWDKDNDGKLSAQELINGFGPKVMGYITARKKQGASNNQIGVEVGQKYIRLRALVRMLDDSCANSAHSRYYFPFPDVDVDVDVGKGPAPSGPAPEAESEGEGPGEGGPESEGGNEGQ